MARLIAAFPADASCDTLSRKFHDPFVALERNQAHVLPGACQTMMTTAINHELIHESNSPIAGLIPLR